MKFRFAAIIAILAMSFTPAFAQDEESEAVGIGGEATLHNNAPAQSDPDNAVGVGKVPESPPLESQGLKGDKGDAGEAGPRGPAGRSSPETDPRFQAWLARSGNQHYKRWSHTGSIKEQVKRLKTLYTTWSKELGSRVDAVGKVANEANSRSMSALAKAGEALMASGGNTYAISALDRRVRVLEGKKNPLLNSSSPTSSSASPAEGEEFVGYTVLAIVIVLLGAVVATGILLH